MPRRGVDLSEEQWRIVKGHAATRGQTISAFFGDVIMEYGLGRAQTKPGGPIRDYPPPSVATHQPDVGGSFGTPRPAPKPARKK